MNALHSLAVLGALAALPLCAAAEKITIPASTVGWYTAAGTHRAGNPNTLTGLYLSTEYCSYYVWAIPPVAGTIVSARIEFQLHYSLGADGPVDQTGEMFDMKTSAKWLGFVNSENGSGHGTDIFADLGTGKHYGTVTVPVSINSDYSIYAKLDRAAVKAIVAAQGASFGVGMINATPGLRDGQSFLVSSGSWPSVQNLILEVKPAASTQP